MKQLRKENSCEKLNIFGSGKNEEFPEKVNHQNFTKGSRKAVVLIVMLLGFSIISSAQFKWGVKLGVNASTQSEIGDICDDNDLKVGFISGIVVRSEMNDWLALKSGIDYQMKGEKCNLKNESSELENKLSYLILPLKAELSASEKAGFKNRQRLFFATGPYFGYLLDAKQTINEQTSDLDNLNDFDFGWSFELGFEFPVLKSNALQVSLNYDMGLSEIVTDADVRNKSASINLGFLF